MLSGEAAVGQLRSSDSDFVASMLTSQYLQSAGGIWTILCIVALVLLWLKPTLGLFKGNSGIASCLIAVIALGSLSMIRPAHAYYSKYDYADPIEINSNWTAFALPESGDNLNTQGKLDSEEYLSQNKIAEKRFLVPHAKMPNSGAFSNYYVPSVRMIIVDRTLVHREWTSSATKGTSEKDEGFQMETMDSINLGFGVTIGAVIKPENAARYLYNFGTVTPTKGTNPNDEQAPEAITYASYVFARPLSEVMDTVGRSEVQTLLTEEFGSRETMSAIHEKKQVMLSVAAKVREYFAARGVTIEWIGYASPLSFDTDASGHSPIQDAINQAFIAQQQVTAANALKPVLPVMESQAKIAIMNGIAKSAEKWTLPNLPSFMVLPANFMDTISKYLPTGAGDQPAAASSQTATDKAK